MITFKTNEDIREKLQAAKDVQCALKSDQKNNVAMLKP
jgi:hypothetical protein